MKRFFNVLSALVLMCCVLCSSMPALAEDEKIYLFDSKPVNTGLDNGFSGTNEVLLGDPQFGWTLGRFTLQGYTDYIVEDGIPVFLVNAGDSIKLNYTLNQNIDKLNGKENCRIANDQNGFDNDYQPNRSVNGFGRGTLFVQYTDVSNNSRIIPHTNFLAQLKCGKVDTFSSDLEEGDYEIALDYEIASPSFPGSKYDNYRTSFRFKVRNGNCKIYLYDINNQGTTSNELVNYSLAPDGFVLDYHNNQYLKVKVRLETVTNNGTCYGLSNKRYKPAKDKAQYTEAGIYTIEVSNKYTGASYTTVVAVGDDTLTNAYVALNCTYSLDELNEMIDSEKASFTEGNRFEIH